MKPENSTIAIETTKLATALLNLPTEIMVNGAQNSPSGEVIDSLTIKTTVTAGRDVLMEVRKTGKGYDLLDVTLNPKSPIKLAESLDLPSALIGALYALVSDVVSSANTKAIEDFVASGKTEHKVFCQECRQLVPEDQFDYTKNVCKQCGV